MSVLSVAMLLLFYIVLNIDLITTDRKGVPLDDGWDDGWDMKTCFLSIRYWDTSNILAYLPRP